jgi:serine/threonine protein kinase
MFEKTVLNVDAGRLQRFEAMSAATASQDDKLAARELLKDITLSMISADGQSVRTGNLRLYRGEDGQARLTLKRFSHNAHNDQANDLVRKLVEIGYGDRPGGPEADRQALDQYLIRSSNKMGSQSLYKLVRNHVLSRAQEWDEPAPNLFYTLDYRRDGLLTRGARIDTNHIDYAELSELHLNLEQPLSESSNFGYSQAEISEGSQIQAQSVLHQSQVQGADQPMRAQGSTILEASDHHDSSVHQSYVKPSDPKELKREQISTFQNAGVQFQRELGAGAMGSAYKAMLNGQQVVVKTNNQPMPFTLMRLAYDDARLAGNIGHSVYLSTPSSRLPDFKTDAIVAPSHYLIRRFPDQAPELMSAAQAREFLKQERVAGRVAAQCEGEVMPMASGEPGLSVIEQQMDDATQGRFFKDMLELGHGLQGRGLLHRDLKPENMFIDPQTGKVQVFDWDFAYKISSKLSQAQVSPTLMAGSPLYLSPKVALAGASRQGYAGEADMHSIGLILLNARYPRTFETMLSPLAQEIKRGQYSRVKPSNFLRSLKSAAASQRAQISQAVAQSQIAVARAEESLKRLDEQLASPAQPRIAGQPKSVAQIQQEVQMRNRLEQDKGIWQKGLQDSSRELAWGREMLVEYDRFTQESSPDEVGHSMTGVALQCLQLANEQPTSAWFQRDRAQGYYQQVLSHPALGQQQPVQA